MLFCTVMPSLKGQLTSPCGKPLFGDCVLRPTEVAGHHPQLHAVSLRFPKTLLMHLLLPNWPAFVWLDWDFLDL